MTTSNEPAAASRRVYALDGLRGVAALVVVIHHALLVSPQLAGAYRPGDSVSGWAAWLVYGPVHLLWAGTEAVYVFFVLSGFVLTLPFLNSTPWRRWQAYYSSRLIRLYLPVIAAVTIAVALSIIVPRSGQPDDSSWWMRAHDLPLDVGIVLQSMSLRHVTFLNGPLWSLRWEVLFSVMLPLFVFGARRIRSRPALIAAALLIGTIGIGAATEIQALTFMPMFGLGSLIAANFAALRLWMDDRGRSARWWMIVVALVLVIWHWWPVLGTVIPSAAPAAAGAALLVLVVATSSAESTLSRASILRWLGSRSFSIYLIHEPVMVSAALVLHTNNPSLVLAVGVPVALLASELFFRVAEHPAHRLASRINTAIKSRSPRAPDATSAAI